MSLLEHISAISQTPILKAGVFQQGYLIIIKIHSKIGGESTPFKIFYFQFCALGGDEDIQIIRF